MSKSAPSPHHTKMMCRVERLEYDFCKRTATVHLPAGHCCDMSGAIAAIEKIDPRVREIQTIVGELPDTLYVRVAGDGWQAFDTGRPRAIFERSC
jgi:hypothetical protein